jgi:hypothetical protein
MQKDPFADITKETAICKMLISLDLQSHARNSQKPFSNKIILDCNVCKQQNTFGTAMYLIQGTETFKR